MESTIRTQKSLQNQAAELEKQLSIQKKEALAQLRMSYDAGGGPREG